MNRHGPENSLEWLTFDLLSNCPRLIHGVFLRHGGLEKALQTLGIGSHASLYQKHTDLVIEADPSKKEAGDALMTDKPDLGLLILHADCQAAIFYDPVRHALANVHCGWRGSVANIYKKTIEKMRMRYGSKPENLLVCISPSLGPSAAEFRNYRDELPESFWPFQIKPAYFDFWEISRWQLTQAGVLPHHIEIARLCTYTHTEDFFSYRRNKTNERHSTIAALKN